MTGPKCGSGPCRGRLVAAVVAPCLAACGSSGPYTVNLMDAPDIYDHGGIDPFSDITPIDSADYEGVLYATDRRPADEPRKEEARCMG